MQTQPSVETLPDGTADKHWKWSFAPLAAILLVAVVLSLPCLTVGLPGDQDGPYHVDYQRDFAGQFWSGELYPRWLTAINAGLGSPIFYLQYPVPYFAATLLSPLVPEQRGQPKAASDLGVVAALALAGSGVGAWLWLRTLVGPWAAAAGAIAYMVLPYHFAVDLYSRAAIGEHCAFIWLPLAMLYARRIARRERYGVPAFAIVLALLVMSHLFTALLFLPVPFLYGLLESPRQRWLVTLAKTVGATMLAFALAAVYLFPLAEHRRWFDHRMLELDGTDNYNFRNHFGVFTESFLRYLGELGRRVRVGALALSAVAAVLLAGAAAAVGFSGLALGWRRRRTLLLTVAGVFGAAFLALPASEWLWRSIGLIRSVEFEASVFTSKVFVATLSTAILAAIAMPSAYRGRNRALAVLAAATGGGAFFMALPYSRPIWEAVPQLALLDFPWRFNTLLTFAAAVLLALGIDALGRTDSRAGLAAIAILLCTTAAYSAGSALLLNVPARFLQPVEFPARPGVEVLLRSYARSQPPDWVRSHQNELQERDLAEIAEGTGEVEAHRAGPRRIELRLQTREAAFVKVNQLFYPTWRMQSLDGSIRIAPEPTTPEGVIGIRVPPGSRQYRLELEETPWEIAGRWVSFAGVLLLAGLFLLPGVRNK